MKGLIVSIIILALIGLLIYKYITRPVQVDNNLTKQDLEKDINKLANHDYYRINQTKSFIQFSIAENKSDGIKTITGTNTNIYGDLSIDTENNTLSVASNTITIDARTFKTDSKDRDGSINRLILKTTTAGNEFITFNLNPITNIPELKINQPTKVAINGTLIISQISKDINFEAEIVKTENGLNINFETNIKRSDFNLKLPGYPGVTVDDIIKIEAKIVAEKF